MKHRYALVALLLCMGWVCPQFSLKAESAVQKETFVFAVKGNDTLRLDKYDTAHEDLRPCVMFVFGGGFFTGSRDREVYIPYYEFLVEQGFCVVAIDYRLNFKDFKPEKKMTGKDFIGVFKETIFMAVEDLYDATNYVLEQAPNWKVDRDMIVTSGSSAGAITVLQAEYERCNRTEVARRLPEDFKYAGVISFAGAIFSDNGALKWNEAPAPLQLFHGDADKNVPFGKIKLFRWGFFGSEYIADKCVENDYPYYFYVEENADHKLAGSPMVV